MHSISDTRFDSIRDALTWLLARAPVVDVGEWQAIKGGDTARTIEVQDVSFEWPIPLTDRQLAEEVKPNLLWAEEHFQERVSGIPYNPPPSHVRWPFRQKDNDEHIDGGKFSHTYPERFWPKYAVDDTYPDSYVIRGIRYDYGDLQEVVALLRDRPGTRQAYLPVWFPEDTGASAGQRVPCTLGYHFMNRGGKLKIVYYIRSCDFYRHFSDDVYMAARLCQWVAEQTETTPGDLVMHISSLHIFEAEGGMIRRQAQEAMQKKIGQW